jgi:hypothetical protein
MSGGNRRIIHRHDREELSDTSDDGRLRLLSDEKMGVGGIKRGSTRREIIK